MAICGRTGPSGKLGVGIAASRNTMHIGSCAIVGPDNERYAERLRRLANGRCKRRHPSNDSVINLRPYGEPESRRSSISQRPRLTACSASNEIVPSFLRIRRRSTTRTWRHKATLSLVRPPSPFKRNGRTIPGDCFVASEVGTTIVVRPAFAISR